MVSGWKLLISSLCRFPLQPISLYISASTSVCVLVLVKLSRTNQAIDHDSYGQDLELTYLMHLD
jgi:hypothetical protein